MKKIKKKSISKNAIILFQNTEIFMYFLGSASIPLTNESRSLARRFKELCSESVVISFPILPDGSWSFIASVLIESMVSPRRASRSVAVTASALTTVFTAAAAAESRLAVMVLRFVIICSMSGFFPLIADAVAAQVFGHGSKVVNHF